MEPADGGRTDVLVARTDAPFTCAFDIDDDGYEAAGCGGDDCDDEDPTIHVGASEGCANGLDDDCDGTVDESACVVLPGSCDLPVEVRRSGVLRLNPLIGQNGASCSPLLAGATSVGAVRVVLDAPASVSLTAHGQSAIFYGEACGREILTDCPWTRDDQRWRTSGLSPIDASLVLPRLEAGTHWFDLGWYGAEPLQVDVAIEAPMVMPTHDTCEGALNVDVAPSTFVRNQSMRAAHSEGSTSCTSFPGSVSLYYRFHLDAPRDMRVTMYSHDPAGVPPFGMAAALYRGACPATAESEQLCRSNLWEETAALDAWSLPAGDYVVAIEAPSTFEYDIEFAFDGPTPVLEGDACADPVEMTPFVPVAIDFDAHHDGDIDACGAVHDWVGTFDLTETADVELAFEGTTGHAALSPECGAAPEDGCLPRRWRLPAGRHYVHASGTGPFEVTVRTAPPLVPVSVRGNASCATALPVTAARTRFSGTLETDGWSNFCVSPTGESVTHFDQLYRFDLAVPSRIALDLAYVPISHAIRVMTQAGECSDDHPVCVNWGAHEVILADAGVSYVALTSQERLPFEVGFSVTPL